MNCQSCQSKEPIYEAGCLGCEARAVKCLKEGVMTRNDVIRMAREAGYDLDRDETCREVSTSEIFMAFARLVAAHEREEMANLCDKMALYAPFVEEQSACEDCAEAIRARGAHADAR